MYFVLYFSLVFVHFFQIYLTPQKIYHWVSLRTPPFKVAVLKKCLKTPPLLSENIFHIDDMILFVGTIFFFRGTPHNDVIILHFH